MITSTHSSFAALLFALFNGASANHKYNWRPSISLVDRASEGTDAGWCPDIVGFGNSINCNMMQTHTCKGQGSDTQFAYTDDPDFPGIYSVNFNAACETGSGGGGCLAVKGAIAAGAQLKVGECSDDSPNQRFMYTTSGYFRISSSDDSPYDLCLGVGEEVTKTEHNYYVRDFLLLECDATEDSKLLEWEVRPMPNNVMNDGTAIEEPEVVEETEIDVDAETGGANTGKEEPEEVLEIPEELEEVFEVVAVANLTNTTNTTMVNMTITATDSVSTTSFGIDMPILPSDIDDTEVVAERAYDEDFGI